MQQEVKARTGKGVQLVAFRQYWAAVGMAFVRPPLRRLFRDTGHDQPFQGDPLIVNDLDLRLEILSYYRCFGFQVSGFRNEAILVINILAIRLFCLYRFLFRSTGPGQRRR